MARSAAAVNVRCLPLGAHIVRWLLVNYRVDPAVLEAQLPEPLTPQLVGGWGVAGICLMAVAQPDPHGIGGNLNVPSQDAAHRIAVEWTTEDGAGCADYVLRRDTDSMLNVLARGRVFPGIHNRAYFHNVERGDVMRAHVDSLDGCVDMELSAALGHPFRATTLFPSLEEATQFFGRCATSYTATRDPLRLDGVELATDDWHLEPLEVSELHSSYFEDPELFPAGSAYFDSAFVVRDLPVQWRALPSMRVMPRMLTAATVG